jgi:L-ribulose-5-phosphate 3-epimerase
MIDRAERSLQGRSHGMARTKLRRQRGGVRYNRVVMTITRRELLLGSAASALAVAKGRGIKVGVTDWNLKLPSQIEALAMAKRIGFEGIQISLGRTPFQGKLPLSNSRTQLLYQAEAMKTDVAINATCLDILHVNFLKSDKLAEQWISEGIEATKALDTQVMLLPCFNAGALETQQEKDRVADLLAGFGPAAEKAKVILAIENTLSAEDNARLIDRTKSKAVKVYYDTYNSHKAGFDIYKEIRWLTSKRMAQIHLKDAGYLGEGQIDFKKIIGVNPKA